MRISSRDTVEGDLPNRRATAATDILLTVYGDSSYLLLTTERGWTHDPADWACHALPVLLLESGSGRETGQDRMP